MSCEAVCRLTLVCFFGSTSIEGYRTLEDLEILQVCVFGIDVALDSVHGDIHIDAVKDLAESGTALQDVSYGIWSGVTEERVQ